MSMKKNLCKVCINDYDDVYNDYINDYLFSGSSAICNLAKLVCIYNLNNKF